MWSYEALFETAPDAQLVVGTDGTILLVNAQVEALFGYPRADLIGQPLAILLPERFREGHAAHLAGYFDDPRARAMGSGVQLCGRRRDGREIAIEVSLTPQRGSCAATVRDLSAQLRLRTAIDSIDDGFAVFDASGRLALCNQQFLSLLGGADAEWRGKTHAEVEATWSRTLAVPVERLHARHDGEPFDATTREGRRLRIIDRRTYDGGLVETVLDRTDDERLTDELREARAVAEAASTAKSEFLSAMSHELRTPLNAIIGFAQLLDRDRREPLSPRHRERVDYIQRGGQHLLRLIDDILDLSRIESGRLTISLEPVEVAEVLQELRTTLGPIAERQHIELAIQAAPAIVRADRTRLAQVLMNLGSNAIKYNRPEGKVCFTVDTTRAGTVRVTVSDTGLGIPEAEQRKLFQPFQRAGQERGSIEGTGIGLVITRRLAELMGGSVGFHSRPNEGSAFWIDLPREAAVAPSPHAGDEAGRVSLPVGKHLVLYVEDNPTNVRFIVDLMSELPEIELASVPTAELGIELARARHPSLILMDINLPGMSGLDAFRALARYPETAGIPVIALTAAAGQGDVQRGLETGFYRYLTKPVKVDELLDAIESALAAR